MESMDLNIMELSSAEIEEVHGGFLVNIGMGIAGAAGAMATYSIGSGISGSMTVGGFAGAAVGGFVYGASGFNPVGGTVGAAAGCIIEKELNAFVKDV